MDHNWQDYMINIHYAPLPLTNFDGTVEPSTAPRRAIDLILLARRGWSADPFGNGFRPRGALSIMFAMSRVLGSFDPVAPIDHWQKNLEDPLLLDRIEGISGEVGFCPKPPRIDYRKQRVEGIVKSFETFLGSLRW